MPTLGEIADLIGAAVAEAEREMTIEGIGPLDTASPGQIAFLSDQRYVRLLPRTQAAAVVVGRRLSITEKAHPASGAPLLEVNDAAAAMQRVLEHLAPPVPRPAAGVHPSASVPDSVKLGRDVAIGPNVVLGERVTLGHGCVLHAGVTLSDDVTLGDSCELFANVAVRERCTIGHRVTIHANSVIGTDGFGYRWDGTKHAKQPHIGTVVIEDDVEIGSCSCIDRGKIDETRIGSGTKIDNLVQVGHNVRIGRHCILCAGVGIAGTAVLGDGVIMGGGAGVRDHVKIGSGVQVAGYSGIHNDLDAGEIVVGVPAIPRPQYMREQVLLRRLPDLVKTIRELQARVEELEKGS